MNYSKNLHVLFIPTFKKVSELLENQSVLVNIPKYGIKDFDGTLIRNESIGFTLEVNKFINDIDDTFDVEIKLKSELLTVSNASVINTTRHFNRYGSSNNFTVKSTSKIPIYELNFCSNTEITYYRFLINTEKAQIFNYLETNKFTDEDATHRFGYLEFTVGDEKIRLYQKKYMERHYFIIDSSQKIQLDKFAEICYSVMLGYGFLSSKFYQNEAFFVTSGSDQFDVVNEISYLQLRPSSLSVLNPIHSNPFSYIEDKKMISEKGKIFTVMNSIVFSKFCTKIYEDINYRTVLLLILEANTATLILNPAGYSVALERMTNIIARENNGLKPISDKGIANKFRNALKETLIKFKEEIKTLENDDAITIFEKKINNINSPTNKDKLIKPFEIYGIKLNDGEKRAIGSRNTFLHGNNVRAEKEISEDVEIHKTSLRLNKLVNKLVLKHLGYQGYVINHLKYNEDNFNEIIEEELFERI